MRLGDRPERQSRRGRRGACRRGFDAVSGVDATVVAPADSGLGGRPSREATLAGGLATRNTTLRAFGDEADVHAKVMVSLSFPRASAKLEAFPPRALGIEWSEVGQHWGVEEWSASP
jgi:hypothetical protein